MQVVKSTGLVPVKSFETGDIFGVPPARARQLLKEKKVAPVEIPEGIETYTVGEPAPIEKSEQKQEEGVQIPENWEEMHHLQRVKLAKEIADDFVVPEGKKASDVADEVIRAEIQRRSAADEPSA